MNRQRNNILVTGATGFIGSHLVKALSDAGYNVVCLALPDEPAHKLQKWNVRIVRGDITDKDSLKKALKDIQIVYHLAAILTSDDTESFYQVNLQGTKNLIQACIENQCPVKRFLFVSSISAVGPTGPVAKDESSPCHPINDYGKSKLQAEEFLKSSDNPYPFTIVRPVEIYGPGRFDSFYNICQAANKGFQINLGEGDITLGYIDDIVRGLILACGRSVAAGQTYFLGENRHYPVAEVTRLFSQAVRRRLIKIRVLYPILYAAAFILEVVAKLSRSKPVLTRWQVTSYIHQCYWKFDIGKAKEELGFEATVSLEEGAKRTVHWYKSEGHL